MEIQTAIENCAKIGTPEHVSLCWGHRKVTMLFTQLNRNGATVANETIGLITAANIARYERYRTQKLWFRKRSDRESLAPDECGTRMDGFSRRLPRSATPTPRSTSADERRRKQYCQWNRSRRYNLHATTSPWTVVGGRRWGVHSKL